MATAIVSASVEGPIRVCDEGPSVWGGVNPATGAIVDAHHLRRGRSLAGHIVLMPTGRGSCTGSGVLLGLAVAGTAPRALIFPEGEDIPTLDAPAAGEGTDEQFGQIRPLRAGAGQSQHPPRLARALCRAAQSDTAPLPRTPNGAFR